MEKKKSNLKTKLKEKIIKIKKYFEVNRKYVHIYIIAGIFIITGVIAGLAYSFALPEEIKEVIIDSDNYNDPGSYRVKKSANWMNDGRAKIEFDFNSIRKEVEGKNLDVLLVLDISHSMNGKKLARVKQDSIELANAVLKDTNNKVGVITFETSSSIITNFTNNKEEVLDRISNLNDLDSTNYYDALVNVDTVMKDYQKETNRNCIALFLTDGYPNVKTPNEVGQYHYLKSEYPYLQINAVQYEMGDDILEPIKKISDKQYIANMKTLNNVLFEASIPAILYEKIEIVDYINSEYFYVKDEKDIMPSVGNVRLEQEGEKQKVIWTIDNLPTASDAVLEILLSLKQNYLETEEEVYIPTNEKEIITTKLEKEEVKTKESTKTPILRNYYNVSYDSNFPDNCDIDNIPVIKYRAGVSVEIQNDIDSCGDYEFDGWKIVTKDVTRYNDDSFVMPDKDVILKATWIKTSLTKTMDGTVYTQPPSIMKARESYISSEKLWKYRGSIISIEFQNKISPVENATESWDLSEDENGTIMGYVVEDTYNKGSYRAYIQGNGGIYAPVNSSYLFNEFHQLQAIAGLEYFDMSKTTNVDTMFGSAAANNTLNLSGLDTSNVTNMSGMFKHISASEIIFGDKFITSNVTDMSDMFFGANSLTSLDISSFDTSNVTNMSKMFVDLPKLTSLDLSNFNTSKVTNMQEMFGSLDSDFPSGFEVLDLSNFDTSNVTNMSSMFYGVYNLTSLDFRNATFDNVIDSEYMFSDVPSNIKITTKNAATQLWLQDKLGSGNGTFVTVE